MARKVVTVRPGASVAAAAETMDRHSIGCLVVTEGNGAVGIVTERDVLRKVVAAGRDPREVRVEEVMTSPVVAVSPDTEVEQAAVRMRQARIRRLAVVSEGKLAGIVTSSDIVGALPDLDGVLMEFAAMKGEEIRARLREAFKHI